MSFIRNPDQNMSGVLDQVVEGFEPTPELVSVMAGSKSAVVLGLDIGTSGVRATLFDERGCEIEGASVRTQRSLSGLSDYSVIDANSTVELVADTIDLLLARAEVATAYVELVSISCFWHSLVGVDSEDRATTPVLGWAETRAGRAAQDLRSRINEAETHSRTGCRFHPSYWPAKLLWLRAEQPETFNKTSRWLSFSEYLTLKFFGDASISVSMASGTGLLNQRTCEWDSPLLEELDISADSLPEIAATSATQANLTAYYALRWPQLRNARLCPAIADGAANNLGSGCTTRDKLAVMIGTSGAARVLYSGEPPDRIPAELWCYRADRSRVLVGGALSDGGGLYRWLHELFLPNNDFSENYDSLEALEADAHGLTVLPFWAGERSTGWSLNAAGGILGLTLDTRPHEILRAAMEAIAYRFALIVKALEPISPGASIIASGNALQSSPVWSQILADVLGRPVLLSTTREASTRGAALLALEAAGKIQSIDDDSDEFEKTFMP
ncbi:MAG: gluconokinase, partial [Pyrinomonadaceae bacterium]